MDPYLARTEQALIDHVRIGNADRFLEVGCGEGGNLKLMSSMPRQSIGVDYSLEKVQWAAEHVPEARFARANATRLPFRDGSFDVVLCRDVLHHLTIPDKKDVLEEIIRVCRDAGRIVIIEPNGRCPIVRLQGLMVEAEKDLLVNSWSRLEPFFDRRRVAEPRIIWAQPFPFGRILFHYRWGLPRLSRFLGGLVLGAERLIGRLIPLQRSAYIVITTIKGSGKADHRAGGVL
jgi:SAM-dependent methyltransferase